MKLADLLAKHGIGPLQPDSAETSDLFIFGVTDDSRDVRFGYLFCALPGVTENGLAFCAQAAAKGAQAIAVPQGTHDEELGLSEFEREKIVILRVANIRQFYARVAADFHAGRPATIASVTGTNGKTSTVCFLRDLWGEDGHNAVSLGTLGLQGRGRAHSNLEAGLTTYDAKTLHVMLGELERGHGVTHLAMEASSHALDQHRLAGVTFDAVGFTNLTQDHLDYHQTMEAYFQAKLRLFTEHLKADGIVIITDFRQADHFEQLFLTVKKWFAAKQYRVPELHHVSFGAVTGEDGKALKTRSGDVIKLKALLDEAVERAYAIVSEKNADLPEAERREVSRIVGIGAVQYADLAQNRSSNYIFSWDKMLALDGNTAPYLLYAVARIHSIFRKAGVAPGEPATETAATALTTPTEITLARKLVKFPDAIRLAGDTLRPHYLSLYLFELASDYSSFNNADKVLVDDPEVRARRLLLCARTLLVLETGLQLLGLRTLTRM